MWQILLLLALVGFAVALSVLQSKHARSMVEQWAQSNDYRLIEARRAAISQGPFTLFSSEDQEVYRVVVEDQRGHSREGWVRCGSWWGGLWSDQTEVRWDDE